MCKDAILTVDQPYKREEKVYIKDINFSPLGSAENSQQLVISVPLSLELNN